MGMEQIIRETVSPQKKHPNDSVSPLPKRKRGRPKGSGNRNKTDVVLSAELKQIQCMITQLQKYLGDIIPLKHLVVDSHFGHNNAVHKAKQCGVYLISKLRTDAALYFPCTTPYSRRGRPRVYGDRFHPQQIAPQWRSSQTTESGMQIEVYQAKRLNKQFAAPLNVVCILKTNLLTDKRAHVLLFSSDLALEAEQMIDYYRLRFQREFNFRDAKQYWGLEDFMNVKPTPVSNAANLSMFMVNLSTKLSDLFRVQHDEFSVIALKARYRGQKYLLEVLKSLKQKQYLRQKKLTK